MLLPLIRYKTVYRDKCQKNGQDKFEVINQSATHFYPFARVRFFNEAVKAPAEAEGTEYQKNQCAHRQQYIAYSEIL